MFRRLLASLSVLLVTLPALASSDSPRVQADGRPFFPIGIYDYPGGDDLDTRHMKEMAESGVNTIHWQIRAEPKVYPFLPRDPNVKDMENARKLGLKVILALNSVAPWTEKEGLRNLGSDPSQFRAGSELDKRIRRFKDHPTLLMYETMDEPGGCREMDNRPTWPSLETLTACYDFVKSVDPVHPVWCNEVAWFWCHDKLSFERFRAWSAICDVYSQDDYPVGGPAYPYCPLFVIPEDMDWMAKTVDRDGAAPFVPEKPLLMVLQGQGRNVMALDRPEIHQRHPNKIETRYAAYSSIVHGAKGILWWGTRDLTPLRDDRGRLTPGGEFWEIVKLTCRELAALQDVYLKDRIMVGFTLGDPRLDAAMFMRDGRRYLIVTNKSDASILDAPITVDRWTPVDPKKTRVLFEQRAVDSADGKTWRDSFAPWDAHVYTDGNDIKGW